MSLTYDDALKSQLTYAVPILDHYGIKATFFLSGQDHAGFAGLTKQGHELASHTVRHPCGVDVARLTLDAMASELDAGMKAVEALGVTGKLSFAYPCGQMKVKNDESYEPLVQARFKAARAVAGIVAQPERVDLWRVPSLFPPTDSDGSDAIALFESAQQSHGWVVIGMHGVSAAGEYLQLSQAAHDKIVSYLAEHRAAVWTAPFGEVADAIAACRASHSTQH